MLGPALGLVPLPEGGGGPKEWVLLGEHEKRELWGKLSMLGDKKKETPTGMLKEQHRRG